MPFPSTETTQGYLLSSLLFSRIEVSASSIRQGKGKKKHKFGKEEVKMLTQKQHECLTRKL